MYDELKWKVLSEEKILHTAIYDVYSLDEVSARGDRGCYVAIDAPEWVVIIAEHDGNFVLVRQWRHGEGRVNLEFPGGVAEPDEEPIHAAERELLEETGFKAGRLTCIGSMSPNPALFKNHFHVFLAEDLTQTGSLNLDSDEILKFEELPKEDVFRRFGDSELTNAFMGTALAFYIRAKGVI
ncbi:MAG: NUDIX hydrolase [Lachnospiraceae bacterium]|nr:NUDIX hydrolase [Lachnospiraceae bacterium]